MTLEEALLEKIRQLPADKKQEVLHFAESLFDQESRKAPLVSPKGFWSHWEEEFTEEEITEARQEMWKNFPRNDF